MPKEFSHLPDSNDRGCQSFSNSTIVFTKNNNNNNTASRIFFLFFCKFVNAIVEFVEWLTTSIIQVGRFRKGMKTLLWITE